MKIFERSWIVFVLWLVALIVAFITTAQLFFNLAYLLGGILILSFAWTWLNIHWLRVTRRTHGLRAQVGKMTEERFEVENTGYLSKFWLEIKDHSDLPGHRASFVVSGLGRKQRRSRVIRTMCLRRGRFRLGPVSVISSDPFGLFVMRRELPLTSHLVVVPRTVELPYFHPPLGELTGGEAAYRRTHYVTTNVSGVRDYSPGDSFNRIHWPSVAKMNRLIVKEFELDPMADVWIVLDMARGVHIGPDFNDLPAIEMPQVHWEEWQLPEIDPTTEEYSIVIAASIARHFIQRGRSVGMITYPNAAHSELIQSDWGDRQEDRLLEVLSVVHPHGSISLDHVLLAEGTRFTRNTTLLIITPSIDPAWVSAARHMAGRGIKVTAIVVDPGSFGAAYNAQSVSAELTSNHVPSYVIRKGDDISVALGNVRRP